MKKFIIFLLIVGAGAGVWFWGKDRYFAPEVAQAQYRFAKIEKRDMINSVSATGALSAVVTVAVGSEVSGQIKELLVDFNSSVKQNQIIARIDPESYETLVRQAEAELAMSEAKLFTQKMEIQRFQAELENAQANLSEAQAQIKKTRATLEDAGRNLERQKTLVQQDFVSKNEYDKAQTAFEEATAQLEIAKAQESAAKSKVSSSKASLAVAKAQIKEAEANVQLKVASLDKRKVDLENTIIRSPVDGVVIDRSVDVGQTVAASLQAPTLFTIAQDLSKMQVSTFVDEADIGRIKEGQTAQFTVDAFGTRRFIGKVKQIRKMGKTVQNVVTYEVIVSADNPDLSLMPGMTADVQIELLKKPHVLAVPTAALRFTPPNARQNEPGSSQAETGGGMAAGGGLPQGDRPDPEARIKQYTERLNLTKSQQEELRRIFQQTGQKMRAAFQSGSPTGPGGMSGLRDKIRKEVQASISQILNSEQRGLYEEMLAESQPKRGRIWRLDETGQPVAISVTLGSSDTSHTEIIGQGIKEGMEIITGIEQG
jgi:HlyD family secretion protein